MSRRVGKASLAAAAALALAACEGRQSVLAPAGEDAIALADLFRVMLIGAVLIWVTVAALFIYVTQINIARMPRRMGETLIIGGGIVFPVLLLGALLIWSMPMMSAQRQPGDGLTVHVTAEQWWWRVEYWPEGADAPIVSANELRLPAGARTELVLNAAKVIHSLWIPALGGKTDMIPGRETRMSLKPVAPGLYRGQCAEFCGASHALMAFETVVMPPENSRSGWSMRQGMPQRPPAQPPNAAAQSLPQRAAAPATPCAAAPRRAASGRTSRMSAAANRWRRAYCR